MSYYYQVRFHNEQGQYIPNPIINNKYKLRLYMPPPYPVPEGAFQYYLAIQEQGTTNSMSFKNQYLPNKRDVNMYRMFENSDALEEYITFTGIKYWQVVNAQYLAYGEVYNFLTEPGFDVTTNVRPIELGIYPGSLDIFQQIFTFGLFSVNMLNNLPLGTFSLSIGDLGSAAGQLVNEGVEYFNVQCPPNSPIQANTLSTFPVKGRISSTYVLNPDPSSPSQTYISSNPLQYYLYNIHFNNLADNNMATNNVSFSYLFSFSNASGDPVSTVVQNNQVSIQLNYNSQMSPSDSPPPSGTPFFVYLQNPTTPQETYTFTGTSEPSSPNSVNLLYNSNSLFNFFQSGSWSVVSAFYGIDGTSVSINTPSGIQVVSNQLQTFVEILPDTISTDVTYQIFMISSMIENNPVPLPNGNYSISMGPFGPFTTSVADNLPPLYAIDVINAQGITSDTPTYYLLDGRITDSLIAGQTYEYRINFVPSPYVSSSNICFFGDTQICCLVDGQETFVAVRHLKSNTLTKILGGGYAPVKYIVRKTIYNRHDLSNKIGKLFIHQSTGLVVTGGHSLLVDELTDEQISKTLEIWPTLEKVQHLYKCLAFLHNDFTHYPRSGHFDIFHVILESENTSMPFGMTIRGPLSNDTFWSETLTLDFFERHKTMKIHENV
jgi:hypothetical protein